MLPSMLMGDVSRLSLCRQAWLGNHHQAGLSRQYSLMRSAQTPSASPHAPRSQHSLQQSRPAALISCLRLQHEQVLHLWSACRNA